MTVKRQAAFDQVNTIAAQIILEHPERWGGEQSLMVQWARAFTDRTAGSERKTA